MSANLTPAYPGSSTALAPAGTPALAPYQPPAPAAEQEGPSMEAQVRRVTAALGRFKWLIGALALVGAVGGIVASRFVDPQYTVGSNVLINNTSGRGGPIAPEQAFGAQGWMDLLYTNQIADSVVVKLALYVEPERAKDTTVFANFQLKPPPARFVPGEYTLEINGPRYTLRDKIGVVNEQGVVGDSVGRSAGFAWRPTRAQLGDRSEVEFRVLQPREAGERVKSRLGRNLALGSNLMFVWLSGTAQQKPAETLNAWMEQFIRIATEIKNQRVITELRALEKQRADAQQRLTTAQQAYERFRVSTIALPSEALAVQGPSGGVATVRNDPAIENYTTARYSLEALSRERQQLEQIAPALGGDSIPVERLLAVGLINTDPAAVTLKASLGELLEVDRGIRVARRTVTDREPRLAATLEQRRTLATRVIPQQYRAFLGTVRAREARLRGVESQSRGEIQRIPERATQGEQLRRDLEAAANLFGGLNQKYAEAQLAERSITPDVRVLDTAVLPSRPTENTLARLIALGLAGGLAVGLGLAVLVDRLDRRFRYPSQVTHGLGLQILGVVPRIDQSGKQTPEEVAQVVEAFRSIRMNTRYACMPNPRVAVTFTSPGPNDGKSLVASNLALSFAEGGWRTVLVDGDLRRGQLNATFDLPSGPGLSEYLEGTSLLGEVVQQTSHENLALVATGARHRRGPELLGTPRMTQLVAALAAEFDAIIVDSPPLGAGIDAYALGAATQNMALVLRRSKSDLKLADAKLKALDAAPVQVIGAVLNEVEVGDGVYQYFSYDPDYVLVEDGTREDGPRADDGEGAPRLPAGR